MKRREFCPSQVSAVEAAKAAKKKTKFLSKERKAAAKKLNEAQKNLTSCKKKYTAAGGMLYVRGLAQAAQDTGQKFPLKPDFKKKAKPFQADNDARKALGVGKNSELYPAALKYAKRLGLDKATQHAATVYALQDALKGATAGFITAQVGAAIVDVVGSYVTLGGYAAAAPAVHAAIGAGQTVTTAALKADIAKNQQAYQQEIAAVQAKKDLAEQKKAAAKDAAKLKELEDLQKKATALEKPEEATEAPVKPWYTSTGVLIGGGLVLGLAVYAATRKPERT